VGEWSTSRPGRALAPVKGPPIPIVQEAVWAPEPVWTQRLEEKSFRLCRGSNLNRPVVQPAARHYTDWAPWLSIFIPTAKKTWNLTNVLPPTYNNKTVLHYIVIMHPPPPSHSTRYSLHLKLSFRRYGGTVVPKGTPFQKLAQKRPKEGLHIILQL
jgi:hypothetical protein